MIALANQEKSFFDRNFQSTNILHLMFSVHREIVFLIIVNHQRNEGNFF